VLQIDPYNVQKITVINIIIMYRTSLLQTDLKMFKASLLQTDLMMFRTSLLQTDRMMFRTSLLETDLYNVFNPKLHLIYTIEILLIILVQ
jgi:hypothetical protein